MGIPIQIFEEYVRRAIEELPTEFAERLNNIVVSVEPYPTPEDLRSVGLRDKRRLLGIFRGIPFGHVSSFHAGPVMPSEIVLFQKNIESIADTELAIIHEIRATLLHEIGHYFGMSEEDLRKYT
jgi:predicted Zn-dependent protease with MMP-like domain